MRHLLEGREGRGGARTHPITSKREALTESDQPANSVARQPSSAALAQ